MFGGERPGGRAWRETVDFVLPPVHGCNVGRAISPAAGLAAARALRSDACRNPQGFRFRRPCPAGMNVRRAIQGKRTEEPGNDRLPSRLRRGRCFVSARRRVWRAAAFHAKPPVHGCNVGRAISPAAGACGCKSLAERCLPKPARFSWPPSSWVDAGFVPYTMYGVWRGLYRPLSTQCSAEASQYRRQTRRRSPSRFSW